MPGLQASRIAGTCSAAHFNSSGRPAMTTRITGLPVATTASTAGGGAAVLDAGALMRLRAAADAAPLIIDFGVPPNVDPEAAQLAGIPPRRHERSHPGRAGAAPDAAHADGAGARGHR